MSDPREEYTGRLQARRDAVGQADRRHRALGYLRLLIALAAIGIAIAVFQYGAISAKWLALPIVLFWWIGARMQRAEEEHTRLSRAVAFYERALARLDGKWAGAGEPGTRFADDEHLYARDLDIFGPASLYELLCLARTGIGQETLAAWLIDPAPTDVIRARQQAIEELTPRLDLREDMAVLGEKARSGVHAEALSAWGEREALLTNSAFRIVACVLTFFGVLAVFALLAYLAAFLGLIDLSGKTMSALRIYFLSLGIIFSAVLWRFKRRTNRILEEAEAAAHDLGLLAGVLKRLESERFTTTLLASHRAALDTGGLPPSRRIRRLNRLMELVDSRHDAAMVVLNPLLLWDLHICYALENWRRISGRAMRRWLSAVGEMEALSSLASHRYEHPGDVFPELAAESPLLEVEAVGHPLIPEDAVVRNDVRLNTEMRVLVVSGSNMSGKSTMLRTLGINVVLALAGAPVRARRMRLSPLSVGASILITDSLHAGESRFYAEITRLRRIVQKAGDTPPLLFLIDEFLHGTNSHDRRIGAEAIVRGLVERGAIGLITTHDLALAHIADALGPRGANVHFEDHLEGGRMRFDYQMRPGVVEKSNAIELMRSVGLEV